VRALQREKRAEHEQMEVGGKVSLRVVGKRRASSNTQKTMVEGDNRKQSQR